MIKYRPIFNWRGLHFVLAAISGIFLLIAASTGVVLSFEPMLHSKALNGADDILLSDLLATLNATYLEVFSVARDNYGNIKIEAIGEVSDGTFYINPFNGSELKNIAGEHPVFDFCRDLHRSLFLKQTGRFFVGVASVAMLFLSVSGIFLLLKRVGDWKQFLSKIVVLDFSRDNHARLGRWFLVPVLVISLSGSMLFWNRFMPAKALNSERLNLVEVSEGNHFEKVKLGDIKELLFPISGDPAEFYELKTHTQTLLLNQESGVLVSLMNHPIASVLHDISFQWHTGEGLGVIYAILLLLSSFATLFFLYSGVQMSRGKLRKRAKNTVSLENASHVVLVGSETGHTYRFAETILQALLQSGEMAFMCSMNDIKEAPQLKQLLVFTSTYGDGDAPENANRFMDKIELLKDQKFDYSVLGFGSKSYKHYCQFAFDAADVLKGLPFSSPTLPVKTVSDLSISEFLDWLNAWRKQTGSALELNLEELKISRNPKTCNFKIINRQESKNPLDDTFLLEIDGSESTDKIHSGDLLGVYLPESNIERYYSIAYIEKTGNILLSIKRTGLCSNYLGALNKGHEIKAFVKKNPSFYPDTHTDQILLIGNGTGIAPFLGFMENNKHAEISLFWGGQTQSSFVLYEPLLKDFGVLKANHLAFSRESPQMYVQDIVVKNKIQVVNIIKGGGQIMICGSLKMREGVYEKLNEIFRAFELPSVQHLIEKERILTDCY